MVSQECLQPKYVRILAHVGGGRRNENCITARYKANHSPTHHANIYCDTKQVLLCNNSSAVLRCGASLDIALTKDKRIIFVIRSLLEPPLKPNCVLFLSAAPYKSALSMGSDAEKSFCALLSTSRTVRLVPDAK